MSERDGYQPGVPCWVDVWHPDLEAATQFYAGLFGWELAEGDGGYRMCQVRGRDVAAIRAPLPPGAASPTWTVYVWVEDAEATAAQAVEAGGRVIAGPMDSLDGGRMVILADPGGAVFGAWQPGEHRGAQVVNEPSAWSMSALMAPDPDAAAAFYGAVFGWQREEFGEGFSVWRLPGFVGGEPSQPVPRDVVAAMAAVDDVTPHWSIDFWVHDADDAAAKASELGGRVVMEPYDIPVGRQAVLADPNGAMFTVSRVGPPR
jgi:predicted enzyme related to lactoylglutathione lyase